jgi:hypothetical protein
VATDKEWVAQTIQEHLSLGPSKAVGYLPINTVEKLLGITAAAYAEMANLRGHSSLTAAPGESCIKSGAVYVYSASALQEILDRNSDRLRSANYPTDAEGFVRAIAREWLADDHPVMPVIRQAFGDAKPPSSA